MMRDAYVVALILAMVAAFVPREAAAQPDTSRIKAALYREVQIDFGNGTSRRGSLVSLSADEIVIRERGTEHRYPLATVDAVVRRTHSVRQGALLGLIIGAPVGVLSMACEPGVNDDCPTRYSWWYLSGALGAGIGAGVGAVIGLARQSSEKNVIYRRPRKTAQLAVAPMLSPKARGVNLAIRW